MQHTYEIRSKVGTPVWCTNNLDRAKEKLRVQSKRVSGLRLFKVTRLEEELPL